VTSLLSGHEAEITTAIATTVFVKSSIVILAAIIIGHLASRSAARMVAVWTMSLGALVTLPFLIAALPSWSVAAIDVSHASLDTTYGMAAVRASAGELIFLVWVLGAVVSLIRLASDWRAANRLARRASSVADIRMIRLLAAAARIVSCGKIPQLRTTEALSTVAVIGWLRPVVLMPADAAAWSDDEVLAVLCHELTHVKRNDWLAMLTGRFVAAVYWPNPLIHLALRLSSGSREMLADEAVLDDRLRVDVYAGRLIATARASNATPQLSVALGFATGDVDVRVRALFARRDRRPVSRRFGLVGSLAALPLLLVLAAAEPWTCVPASTSSTTAISCD